MGFPGFYGRNMNAWIDCMTHLDEPCGAGMTNIALNSDEACLLDFEASEALSKKQPEILTVLIECTAAVNQRAKNRDRGPLLALAFS